MSQAEAAPERSAPAPAPVEIAAPAPLDHDPDTGETGPRVLAVPQTGNAKNWVGFGQAFIAAIQTAASREEVQAWYLHNVGVI